MPNESTGWTQSTIDTVPIMTGVQIEDTDLRQTQIAQLQRQRRDAQRLASFGEVAMWGQPLDGGVVRDYGLKSGVNATGELHQAACAVVVVRVAHNGNRVTHIWRDGIGRKLTRGECTTLVGRMRCHETLSQSSLPSQFAPDN